MFKQGDIGVLIFVEKSTGVAYRTEPIPHMSESQEWIPIVALAQLVLTASVAMYVADEDSNLYFRALVCVLWTASAIATFLALDWWSHTTIDNKHSIDSLTVDQLSLSSRHENGDLCAVWIRDDRFTRVITLYKFDREKEPIDGHVRMFTFEYTFFTLTLRSDALLDEDTMKRIRPHMKPSNPEITSIIVRE